MPSHEFTLHFALGDPDLPIEERLDALFDAGCDDSLPGIGRRDSIALAFSRKAASAQEAVLSALSDASTAMPDARLTEADPDLVGLTDVAELLGFSRQYMRKLLLASAGSAPASVHDGAPSLWHLADMLSWLVGKGYEVDRDLAEIAAITMQVNLAVQAARADDVLQREIARAVG